MSWPIYELRKFRAFKDSFRPLHAGSPRPSLDVFLLPLESLHTGLYFTHSLLCFTGTSCSLFGDLDHVYLCWHDFFLHFLAINNQTFSRDVSFFMASCPCSYQHFSLLWVSQSGTLQGRDAGFQRQMHWETPEHKNPMLKAWWPSQQVTIHGASCSVPAHLMFLWGYYCSSPITMRKSGRGNILCFIQGHTRVRGITTVKKSNMTPDLV